MYIYRGDAMTLMISNSSESPIYEQITEQLKTKMITGELKPGETLPSIRGLAKDLKISVITTKRAYEELERLGYIETVPGKGSFVSGKNKELLKEELLKTIESNFINSIEIAKKIKLTKEELLDLFTYLYEEDQNEK